MGVHGSRPRSAPTLGSETVQIASTRFCPLSFALNPTVVTLAMLSVDMDQNSPDQRDRCRQRRHPEEAGSGYMPPLTGS